VRDGGTQSLTRELTVSERCAKHSFHSILSAAGGVGRPWTRAFLPATNAPFRNPRESWPSRAAARAPPRPSAISPRLRSLRIYH